MKFNELDKTGKIMFFVVIGIIIAWIIGAKFIS